MLVDLVIGFPMLMVHFVLVDLEIGLLTVILCATDNVVPDVRKQMKKLRHTNQCSDFSVTRISNLLQTDESLDFICHRHQNHDTEMKTSKQRSQTQIP